MTTKKKFTYDDDEVRRKRLDRIPTEARATDSLHA
jgi:hypothetical protein